MTGNVACHRIRFSAKEGTCSWLKAPGRNIINDTAVTETAHLSTIQPVAHRWKEAIKNRDRPAAIQAGEDYESTWQAVEVYVNHRSLALYTDLENDTQFVIDQGLSRPQPNWPHLFRLAERLCEQIDVAITFVAAQPPLSPLFDDLVSLRRVRASLLISRNALRTGELVKAREAFTAFTAGLPGVEGLITLRSASAVAETLNASNATSAAFANPGSTAAELAPLVAVLLDRYDVGLNLTNAAARAADVRKAAPTAEERTGLIQLNDVALGLQRSLPKFPSDLSGAAAGAATGPGSDFAKVQPVLEAKARRINTAAPLRSALAGYQDLVLANSYPSTSQVATAYKTALEAVALAQQTLVGQFWTDPALQAFLDGLPRT